MAQSTITIEAETKAKLALLKGDRSWQEFMEDVLVEYPSEEALLELRRRLDDLQSGRAKPVPWSEVKPKLKRK